MNKSLVGYFILGLVLCIPVIFPYFSPGFFPTHDGEWAVVRAGEMFREIRDLQFPARYSGALNFGYGYPLFNFAYPFPYYIATAFHFLHIGFVDSIKTIFAGSVLVSFAGMFFLARHFWKTNLAGLLSGLLYVYLPYRMVDLYVRGSIGESVALALYPFLLLSMFLVLEKKRNIGIVLTALFSSILFITHNISAVYFSLIFVAFLIAIYFSEKRKITFYVLGAYVWGALISSFFIIPAFFEKSYIRLSVIPIADRTLYYVSLPKLFLSKWGYGTPTDSNPFTYQVGAAQFLGFVTSVFVFKKKKGYEKNILLSFIVLVPLFVFMMFSFSDFLWKLPLLSEINYPWTLLLPIGFLMCFLAPSILNIRNGKVFACILIGASIVLTFSYAKPETVVNRGESYYLTNEATTTSSNELMPLWVKDQPSTRFTEKVETSGKISDLVYSSDSISFSIELPKKEIVSINQIFYPGWEATINNNKSEIAYHNKKGIIQLQVPEGTSNVQLSFKETPLRTLSDVISVIALMSLILYGAFFARKEYLRGRSKRK